MSEASVKPLPQIVGLPLAILSVALAIANFMQVLDSSIANVSVPTIAGNLGVSSDQGTWIITSFAVSNGVSLPLTGWVMQRFGVVRTFVISVLLFTLASLLCGLAWNIDSLIAFRVLQGAMSGPMIPGSQALLIAIFPSEKRGTALAIWSMTTMVAPIFGPILGGYISDNYTWPWIFFINVPIGVASAAICWRGLAGRETPTRQLPIDIVGFILLLVWVGGLQVMLDRGKDADWFASTTIVVLALAALIGFIGWVIWEVTDKHPIVDLSLFASRNFALGNLVYCLGYAVFLGNVVLMPLWLQTQENYTATWAGLVAVPSGIVAVFCSPFGAKLMAMIDARWVATLSFVGFAVSFFIRADLSPGAGFWDYVLPMLALGVGMSLFFVALLTISLNGIQPQKVPAASGLINFARITAGSFATAMATTIWDRREAVHQTRLADSISLYDPATSQALAGMHAAGLSQSESFGTMTETLVNQAYFMSAIDIFWVSGWLCIALIPMVWLTKRAMGNSGPKVAAD